MGNRGTTNRRGVSVRGTSTRGSNRRSGNGYNRGGRTSPQQGYEKMNNKSSDNDTDYSTDCDNTPKGKPTFENLKTSFQQESADIVGSANIAGETKSLKDNDDNVSNVVVADEND